MRRAKFPLIKPLIKKEAQDNLAKVLKSGWLTQGRWVLKSEGFLKRYLGIKFARLLNSATSGLICALKALGLPKGRRVIVPSFTFPATVNAVVLNGLRPIFCDIDLNTFNICPEKIPEVITRDTKALMVVHEFGLPADMGPIIKICKKYDLFLIEDAACSLGAEYRGKKAGTLGHIGVFSFHPRKIVTSGEGGAVVTDSFKLSRHIECLRNHGELNQRFVDCGYNFRLSDIQASILYEQLKRVESIVSKRIRLASNYHKLLEGLESKGLLKRPLCPWNRRHTYQSYVVLLDKKIDRNRVKAFLRQKGIESQFGTYCVPLLDYYRKNFKTPSSHYKNAHFAYKHSLTLPLYEGLNFEGQEYIVENLKNSLKRCVP